MDTLKTVALAVMVLGMVSCATPRKSYMVGAYSKSSKLTAEDDSLFRAVVLSHSDLQLRPVKVARQVVGGMNYRYECVDRNKRKVEVIVFEPLPGRGAAHVVSVNGKAYTE